MKNKSIIVLLLILLMNCDKLFPEDNDGPIISILKPLNFEKVNESVKILPLSPNYDIPKVEIELSRVEPISISLDSLIFLFENELNFDEYVNIYDSEIIGSDNDGKPLIYFWDTTTKLQDICCEDYPDSSIWFMRARGYDSSNNKTDSDGIYLMVDNSISNPHLININSILLNENGAFIINWDKSEESDFYSYILTKSMSSEMLEIDTIHQSFNIDSTSYLDSLINPLVFQYYEITVLDSFGYSTTSEIFSSSLDSYPLQIVIKEVSYNYDSMTVIWNEPIDNDIKELKLLFSLNQLDDKDTLFSTLFVTDTMYSIIDSINFDPTIENWFWIMAVDTFSQSTIGNPMSNEINLPPGKNNITSINFEPVADNFDIFWEQNEENDFLSYTLFESLNNDMSNSNLVSLITDPLITNHVISNIDYGEIRYYQILTGDAWDQKTLSDIYEGNSNYYYNKSYDLYQTNDNLNSILNLCDNDYNGCKYLISGTSTPYGDTRPDLWVSIVDSLGYMDLDNNIIYSYNNSGEIDQVNSAIETFDNNFIINATIGNYSSTAYDAKLIKLNASDLSLLWEANLCEMDANIDCGSNKNYSKSLKELDNNNFLLTGYTVSNNSADNLWIMQTDNNGSLLNSFHRITENLNDSPPYNDIWDEGEEFDDANGDGIWNEYSNDARSFDIIQDGDDFVVVGSIELNNEKDIFISKYNSSLNLVLWEKIWENSGNDEAYSIEKDNNDFIITGYKTNDYNGDKDIVILKIQSDGENLQEILFSSNGAQDEVANKIIKTSDDNFILIGYTSSFGDGGKDIFVVKFKDSFVEWQQTYGCELDDVGYDIKETFEGTKGGFIIAGKIYNDNTDAWLIKTNHNGETTQILCDD